MNEQNHEQRIAELEKAVANLKTWVTALTIGFAQSADTHQTTSIAVQKNILAMTGYNETAFAVLSSGIPDEKIRGEFRSLLAKSDFNRDQLAAMLQAIESQPLPSSALAAFLAQNPLPLPPGSPAQPSAPPGAS